MARKPGGSCPAGTFSKLSLAAGLVALSFDTVLNPWSALYVGFNNNESNLQLVENEQGQTELVRTEDLARDGRQLFVKFSYLFQP